MAGSDIYGSRALVDGIHRAWSDHLWLGDPEEQDELGMDVFDGESKFYGNYG